MDKLYQQDIINNIKKDLKDGKSVNYNLPSGIGKNKIMKEIKKYLLTINKSHDKVITRR